MSINNEDNAVRDLLNGIGIKYTRPRAAVISVLINADIPLTAAEISQKVAANNEHADISTIYRTLELMTDVRLVEKTDLNDGFTRYKLIGNKHRHHIICTECNRMIPFDVCLINEIEETLKKQTDFDITGHKFELYGICPDCKRK